MPLNPIEYTGDQQEFIESYMSQEGFDHNCWNDNNVKDDFKRDFTKLKSEIKSYYKQHQRHTCPYCKNQIPLTNGQVWHIEHIVPKSLNCHLMFKPSNICVACVDCNISKGSKGVFFRQDIEDSEIAADYKIVHPFFDEYSDHIEKDGYAYLPLDRSEKGKNTIRICKLDRFISLALDDEQRDTDIIDFSESISLDDEDLEEQIDNFVAMAIDD